FVFAFISVITPFALLVLLRLEVPQAEQAVQYINQTNTIGILSFAVFIITFFLAYFSFFHRQEYGLFASCLLLSISVQVIAHSQLLVADFVWIPFTYTMVHLLKMASYLIPCMGLLLMH